MEDEIERIEKHTGIATTDFVRFGSSKIWELIKKGKVIYNGDQLLL